MCVACGAAVWWSVDNASSVRHRLQTDIHNVVRLKYGRGASGATEAIVDKIQMDFECCGVKGIAGTVICRPSPRNLPFSRETRRFRLGDVQLQLQRQEPDGAGLRSRGSWRSSDFHLF